MKWPLPFVRRKAKSKPPPVSLADRLRDAGLTEDAARLDRILDDLDALDRAEVALATARDGTPAEFDGLIGDDGSPSMLEGGR